MCTKPSICLKTLNSRRLEGKTFVVIFFDVPHIKPLRTTLEQVWMGLLLNCSCTGLSFGRSPTHDDPQIRCEASLEYNVTSKLQ
jgi:hypothetical protein